MCRGANNHKYCVMVKATGVELEYSHRKYLTAAKHLVQLGTRKQPRLSRWYNAPFSPAAFDGVKVMIKRTCKNKRT